MIRRVRGRMKSPEGPRSDPLGRNNLATMNAPQPGPDRVVIRNVRVFDGIADKTADNVDVLIESRRVVAVSSSPIAGDQSDGVLEIQADGKFLMPGLSDAHAHLMGNANTMLDFLQGPTGVVYGNTIAGAKDTLLRGFTTVRDLGGDTASIKSLIDRGTFEGPRIFPSQAMISQTSGHADFAFSYEAPAEFGGRTSRTDDLHFTRVANGVPHVLAAVREQLRQGASQIKLTVGGGVSSMYDPLNTLQYTSEEIEAAVKAASDYGTYVATHVYTVEGIRRAVAAGVKSIEHGHLADEDTIKLLADEGVWLSMQPFLEPDHHYADASRTAKNAEVCQGTDDVYGWAKQHGVKTAWGTDLLLEPKLAARQSEMAARLGQWYSNVEALKMLTSGNAELFELAGPRNSYGAAKLGVIAEGAWADLILVDGDPLEDLSVIADPDDRFVVIMKDGRIVKNTL